MKIEISFENEEAARTFANMMVKIYDIEMQGSRWNKAALAKEVRKQILAQMGVKDDPFEKATS